ncbi:hypothetical protein B0H34DRAFT_713210 [Crassisporium funariophilum]|nr:hypothetical protein B0H34DRAFT_713210 [Crassisporium funariophilum]
MRFFSLFALACAGLQAASALPISNPDNDRVARNDLSTVFSVSSRDTQLLEARNKNKDTHKHVPPPPPAVTLEKNKSLPHSPHNTLDRLNLHGDKRKAVVDYHTKVVEDHMKTVPGAHSAVIKNLAHSAGSRDPKIHISATVHDKHGASIGAPRHGNPAILDPTHHIYTNKENPADGYKGLPIEYKKAVDKKRKAEGKQPGSL